MRCIAGLCAIMCVAAVAWAEPVVETWPNGQTRERYTVNRNGEKHGRYRAYDADGKLVVEQDYANGKLNGRSKRFEQGELVSERVYVGGELIYPRTLREVQHTMREISRKPIEAVGVDPRKEEGEQKPPLSREQVEAMRVLMTYRYLCGVPWEHLQYDHRLGAHADAASELLQEIGKLEHKPANPGWPADEYRFAFKGTSSSNLCMGKSLSGSVHAYMDDSDPSNIERLGHRRWCLNPSMGKTGIAGRGVWSAMWAFDQSHRDVPDDEYTAYPAAGVFPASYFGTRHAWSVTLNPSKFSAPTEDAIEVTIRRVAVSVRAAKVHHSEPIPLDYFRVDRGGFGVPNCIIFRPSKLELRPGTVYQVQITGVKRKDGGDEPIRYYVEFVRL